MVTNGEPGAGSLRTGRLALRRWQPTDVEEHFDIYSRWEVARWLGAEPRALTSREQSVAAIERWADRHRSPFGLWAVVPDAVGHPVGSVLLVPLQDGDGNPADEVEVGWHLHPDHWGRGYATEGSRVLLEAAWTLGLGEVWAVVRPGNERSVAVTARLGMAPQGLTERWYGVPLESFRATAPHHGP